MRSFLFASIGLLFGFASVASPLVNEPVKPLPAVESLELDEGQVALGNKLFHDTRLSKDNTLSCASCHDLNKGGTDQVQFSTGVGGHIGSINSPTVYNSGFNFKQFWDGRAETLEEQAGGPITDPGEMASTWEAVLTMVQNDPEYIVLFEKNYDGVITEQTVSNAIAVFERSLITPSRFDDYLLGDVDAITPQEKRGYELFKSYGCTACHSGFNLGGQMFQKMGLVKPYFDPDNHKKEDKGRYNVTGNDTDMHFFKVPTMRNVTLTAPYMHDGSIDSLEETVKLMGEYQLGQTISDEDAADIVAFLNSLTGKTLESGQKT